MSSDTQAVKETTLRKRIFNIIEPRAGETRASTVYDVFMLVVIVASLVPLAFKESNAVFDWIDRVAVVVFIVDYLLRFMTADLSRPKLGKKAFLVYPFTPLAIIDLLSILPLLSTLNDGFRLFRVFRLVRALQVFRVFKVFRYSRSVQRITSVFKKQTTPLLAVCTLAIGYIFVSALVIFNVEPETFPAFFDALYWATVSLTAVGYGDIYPVTALGQSIAMISSFLGIAIVALPAGIITAGYMEELQEDTAADLPTK